MPKAKFEGICRSIKQKIEAQDYPYQSLLPAESELIQEYGCARNTLRRALADLTAAGYLQPIQGKGVRVIYRPAGKTAFLIGVIESFQETDQRNNLHAVTKVGAVRAGGDRRAPGLPERVHGGRASVGRRAGALPGGQGLILDVNYFSQAMVPGLTAGIAARSIYEYIEKVLHIRITTTKRRVTVERATTRDEALLDLDGYGSVGGGVQPDLQRRRAAVRVHPVPPSARLLLLRGHSHPPPPVLRPRPGQVMPAQAKRKPPRSTPQGFCCFTAQPFQIYRAIHTTVQSSQQQPVSS